MGLCLYSSSLYITVFYGDRIKRSTRRSDRYGPWGQGVHGGGAPKRSGVPTMLVGSDLSSARSVSGPAAARGRQSRKGSGR